MRINRAQWEPKFFTTLPQWPCPTCHQGTLIRTEGEWTTIETAESIAARTERFDDWEPDWETSRAVGFMRCTNCSDPVAVIAEVGLVACRDEQYGPGLEPGYWPHSLLPAPELIAVPPEAAEPVRAAMLRAFALYWSDPSSSGNCIRTAIEAVLDQFRISRTRVVTHHGRRSRAFRPLHERLLEAAKRFPTLQNTLMALKWLGNAGTHHVLTHGDVLQAMDFLDHAFDEIYRRRSETLAKAAKEIIRRRGPARHRSK